MTKQERHQEYTNLCAQLGEVTLQIEAHTRLLENKAKLRATFLAKLNKSIEGAQQDAAAEATALEEAAMNSGSNAPGPLEMGTQVSAKNLKGKE